MSGHLSSLVLDQLALGALSPEAAAEAGAHLAACERCRADQELAAAAHERFSRDILPRTLPAIRDRAGATPRRRLWWALAPALAAACALVFVLRPRPPDEPDLLEKGAPSLSMFAKRGGQVQPVDDGAQLAPGDAVRFVLHPSGLPYVLVASVDGSGGATIYHPFGGDRSAEVPRSGRVELPGSVVLDQSPGPERVFALFSRAPLGAAEITTALRRWARADPTRSAPSDGWRSPPTRRPRCCSRRP